MAKRISGFDEAGHLPNNRAGRLPADPLGLPRQRAGITPQMHGRYPDYDVLSNAGHWDALTRDEILSRVHDVPVVRFFDEREQICLRALLDVLLAQDAEPRIPVLEAIDARLHIGQGIGYRYADMPDDGTVWKLVAAGADEEARRRGAPSYADASEPLKLEIAADFADGTLHGRPWDGLNVSRAWSIVTRDAVTAFYSHPWAWNEIGFGGPAYPRGYMRLGPGEAGADPNEAHEATSRDPVLDTQEDRRAAR
jgi:hypothetical protein